MNKSYTLCLTLLFILSLNASAQVERSAHALDKLMYSKLDYSRLSDDVKHQINKNKLADVSLFDGIARAFVADITVVNSSADIEKELSFLYKIPNLKKVNYIARNRVEIIATIDTEATLFKEVFLSHSVNSNFIEQKLVVHQVK